MKPTLVKDYLRGGVVNKSANVPKDKYGKPLSMDKQAALIMQKIWFNKELGVNLTPKEYNTESKLVSFLATSNDGKTKYNYISHVRDIQSRIEKGVLKGVITVI